MVNEERTAPVPDERVRDNLVRVRERIAFEAERCGRDAGGILLVGVTKTRPASDVLEAVRCGLKAVGENRVQELLEKRREIPGDLPVQWRFIGHLQRNKARKAAEAASTVDSVDSLPLAAALSRIALEMSGAIPVLLEVNTSGEKSKSGVHPSGAEELLEGIRTGCPGLRVEGLMTIGPLSGDEREVRRAFGQLRLLRDDLAGKTGLPLKELSMGMSGDFQWAIPEGSTMVRIGSAIFGERSK